MPKELTKEARERIATLVGDVAYGGTKEAIRFLIISAFLAHLYEVDEEEPLAALLAYFQPSPPPPPPLGRRNLSRSWFSSRSLLRKCGRIWARAPSRGARLW